MPKILMAAFAAAIFCVSVQAQENSGTSDITADISTDASVNTENSSDSLSGSDSENSGSDLFGDIGDLFDNASDSDETVVTDKQESGSDTTFSLASLSIPLKMSGDISAELGVAAINSDGETSGSAYFDLVNYLYFTTRPDKYMAVKGSLKTSLIDSSEADVENQNQYFYLYELYFDYIMADKVYITAGKKKTVWGNIRLFSNDDDFEDDEDALYTNALYDSRYNISGIIRIPFGLSTLTILTMYRGGSDEPSHRELSYAGNAEAIVFGTSLNFFARVFPSRYGELSKYYNLPIVGAEAKRTVFGTDLYAQLIGRVNSNSTLREFWKSDLYKKSAFERFVFTGGFYKLFTDFFPYFGINAEYQAVYYPNDVVHYEYNGTSYKYLDDLEDAGFSGGSEDLEKITVTDKESGDFEQRLIVDVGLAKLGKERNLKVGVQWYHNITEKSGYIKPAFIASRIVPHCDWRIGLKWEYWKDQEYFGKFTLGSYLKFSLGY